MSKCRICGQCDVDGAIDKRGEFVCLDCIYFGEVQRNEIIAMCPVEGFDYPPECYDVDRYFPEKLP